MMRRLRLGVPLIAVAVVTGAVLFIIQPWSQEEAAGQPVEFSLCNVSVGFVPQDVAVGPYPLPTNSGQKMHLLIYAPLPQAERVIIDPGTAKGVPVESRVAIDAQTGEVVFEHYRTTAEEAKLKGVLATLRVGPPDPSVPAWPRTDTPPRAEKVEVSGPDGLAIQRYRPPDPGSGILVSVIEGTPYFFRLVARTCSSKAEIDGQTGAVVTLDVTPEEMQMFQRFLAQIERRR